jgi:hypothetical protein
MSEGEGDRTDKRSSVAWPFSRFIVRSLAERGGSGLHSAAQGLMVRVFTQKSQPIVRLALVVDPQVRRAARARTERFVVRIKGSAFADHVSFNPIVARCYIDDVNTISLVLPNDVQLNDICVCIVLEPDSVTSVRPNEVHLNEVCVYVRVKRDSILTVVKHLIFLDQIARSAVL